jgi:hypothetical protein
MIHENVWIHGRMDAGLASLLHDQLPGVLLVSSVVGHCNTNTTVTALFSKVGSYSLLTTHLYPTGKAFGASLNKKVFVVFPGRDIDSHFPLHGNHLVFWQQESRFGPHVL